ncbi:MAG: 16S rRNA (cytidine(1402)-2'-O)-methyltransferase [Abitibacteriaceae bacterium]|nr:16S rRNA (cytidine(1402)-2'-O)-methyltransferase [Abditibacteriaceae bacterium]
MSGLLYVCATPIGNLEDVSLRLLATLREVNLICAEDTRHTQRLLARHDVHTPLTSCHQHTSPAKLQALVARLLSGESLALVTDAGTPGVSDPGPRLVLAAAQQSIPVVPIPGPCALAAALSISGLDAQRFSFLGFLPRKPGRHRKTLEEAIARNETLVLYESPYRVAATLEVLANLASNRPTIVCRELTKKFEEVVRGTTAEVAADFKSRKEVRGEFVVIFGAVPTVDETEGD